MQTGGSGAGTTSRLLLGTMWFALGVAVLVSLADVCVLIPRAGGEVGDRRLLFLECLGLMSCALAVVAIAAGLVVGSVNRLRPKALTPRLRRLALWLPVVIVASIGFILDTAGASSGSMLKVQAAALAVLFALLVLSGTSWLDSRSSRPLRALAWPIVILVAAAAAGLHSFRLEEERFWQGQFRDTTESTTSSDGPNVVLIVMDAARADRFSFMGYDRATSPRLDQFAANGVVFERAFSTSSWTLPAHASLFTGLYPGRHRAHGEHLWLDGESSTLAELLSDAGYQTACFSNNWYVSSQTGMDRGFGSFWHCGQWDDRQRIPRRTLFAGLASRITRLARGLGLAGPSARFDVESGSGRPTTARATNEVLLRWLDRRPDVSIPFFVFINYMEPHQPYEPCDRSALLYLSADELRVARSQRIRRPTLEAALDPDGAGYGSADFHLMNGLYDGDIHDLDREMGSLFDRLDARGLLDEALVIVTSDHGEYLGEHNRIGHGSDLHDVVFRVPLVIRGTDGFPGGTTNGVPVNLIDVFHTVLAAAGIEPETEPVNGGLALQEILSEPDSHMSRRVFGEEFFSVPLLQELGLFADCSRYLDERKASRDRQFHLIWHHRKPLELYDCEQDPAEVENLAQLRPDLVQALMAEMGDVLRMPEYSGAFRTRVDLSPQQYEAHIQRLRELGYVR